MQSLVILHDKTEKYRVTECHRHTAKRESSKLLMTTKIFNKRLRNFDSGRFLLNFPNRHCATHLMTRNQQSLPSWAL
jgi:hypothetical protein